MSDVSAFGAAIGGASDLLGQMYSASQAREMNRRQENFQREMSNTSHQREVEDLRKAGLNPILSATGGAGASTPPGSSIGPASIDASRSMASALSVLNLKKDLGLAEKDMALKDATTKATAQSAKESLAREQGIKQSTGIDANKFEFEKQWREMDKAFDYGSKGAGAVGDLMQIFRRSGSAKSQTLKAPKGFAEAINNLPRLP